MPSRSVVPDILAILEPYLERKIAEWEAQPVDKREPSLPYLTDRKVSVRGIVHDLGLPQAQEQHLFKKKELASVVNLVAREQGLKPIGSRSCDAAEDEVARKRIAMLAANAKKDQEGHAVARVEVARLSERVQALQEENERLRALLGHVQAGGMLLRTRAAE